MLDGYEVDVTAGGWALSAQFAFRGVFWVEWKETQV